MDHPSGPSHTFRAVPLWPLEPELRLVCAIVVMCSAVAVAPCCGAAELGNGWCVHWIRYPLESIGIHPDSLDNS